MARCLLLVTTSSYRTDAFVAAAARLGVSVVLGSDRCHQLAQRWSGEAYAALEGGPVETTVALEYRHPEEAAGEIVALAAARRLDAIVATDDATAIVAALSSARLGLPGNAPAAVSAARDKSEMRRLLRGAGVPAPRHLVFPLDVDARAAAGAVAAALGFPAVAKPLLLSASRGVIRADDAAALAAAFARIGAIVRGRAEFADGAPAARQILVEEFVPGMEVALEGILRAGSLRTLALFDKPDPLDGPFFEETIYVTPSRHPAATQRAIERVAAAACSALGLREGPVHAELRLAPSGPVVIEVAARSIGGLCARTLRFSLGGAPEGGSATGVATADHALEDLVLAHALGRGEDARPEMVGAAGVMMLPIPGEGVLHEVAGVQAARAVPLIEDVVITARPGERLVPLPEGSSYPGFIFARGPQPAQVEAALRAAWTRLHFELSPTLR